MVKDNKKEELKEPEIPTKSDKKTAEEPKPTPKKAVQKKFSKFMKGK